MDKPAVLDRLFANLQPTRLKVVIPEEYYNNGADDGSLNGRKIENGLIKLLMAARQAGITEYYTSVTLPPRTMREHSGNRRGMQYLHPNGIAVEREDDYVAYLVSVFSFLQKHGLEPPRHHSLQNAIGFSGLENSCPYTPDQWARLVKKMRAAFDRAGFQSIALIGPDDISHQGNVLFMGGPRALRLSDDAELRASLSVFGYANYTPGSVGVPTSMERLTTALPEGMDIWMTGWSALESPTEREACLAVFDRLVADFIQLRANFWTFQPAYQLDRVSFTLVYGEGHTTELYWAMRHLWKTVRPGFRVRRGLIESKDALPTTGANLKETVAFEGDQSLALLLVNHDDTEMSFSVELTQYSRASFWNGGQTDYSQVITGVQTGGASEFRIPLRRNSIAIVKFEP